MHLDGEAARRPYAPENGFDLNRIDLAKPALAIYALLPEQQRAPAFDRGLVLNPYDQDLWRFRVRERFERERPPAGGAELGSLELVFDHGDVIRSTDLAITVPSRAPLGAGG